MKRSETEITPTTLLACDCPLWGGNLPKLNGFITMGVVHGMTYDGEQFLFCPWCGKKRKKSNDKAETSEVHSDALLGTWQPMTTVPRDRRVLLALNGRVWIAAWDRDYRVWRDGTTVSTGNASGWMMIPKMPNANDERQL